MVNDTCIQQLLCYCKSKSNYEQISFKVPFLGGRYYALGGRRQRGPNLKAIGTFPPYCLLPDAIQTLLARFPANIYAVGGRAHCPLKLSSSCILILSSQGRFTAYKARSLTVREWRIISWDKMTTRRDDVACLENHMYLYDDPRQIPVTYRGLIPDISLFKWAIRLRYITGKPVQQFYILPFKDKMTSRPRTLTCYILPVNGKDSQLLI